MKTGRKTMERKKKGRQKNTGVDGQDRGSES